jgi:hypothetical protein
MKGTVPALIVLISLLVSGIVIADEGADTAPGKTVARRSTRRSLPLEALRDPFWPVGWHPPRLGPVQEAEEDEDMSGWVKWDEAQKRIRISGISRRGDRRLAVVNGVGVVEKGDLISVTHGRLIYRWEVASISDHGIVPVRRGVYLPK